MQENLEQYCNRENHAASIAVTGRAHCQCEVAFLAIFTAPFSFLFAPRPLFLPDDILCSGSVLRFSSSPCSQITNFMLPVPFIILGRGGYRGVWLQSTALEICLLQPTEFQKLPDYSLQFYFFVLYSLQAKIWLNSTVYRPKIRQITVYGISITPPL